MMRFELFLLLISAFIVVGALFLDEMAVIVFCGVGLFCVFCACVCFWAEQFGKSEKCQKNY